MQAALLGGANARQTRATSSTRDVGMSEAAAAAAETARAAPSEAPDGHHADGAPRRVQKVGPQTKGRGVARAVAAVSQASWPVRPRPAARPQSTLLLHAGQAVHDEAHQPGETHPGGASSAAAPGAAAAAAVAPVAAAAASAPASAPAPAPAPAPPRASGGRAPAQPAPSPAPASTSATAAGAACQRCAGEECSFVFSCSDTCSPLPY